MLRGTEQSPCGSTVKLFYLLQRDNLKHLFNNNEHSCHGVLYLLNSLDSGYVKQSIVNHSILSFPQCVLLQKVTVCCYCSYSHSKFYMTEKRKHSSSKSHKMSI